jgi:acetate kinase
MRILVLNAGSSSLKTSVVIEPGDRTEGARTQALPTGQHWADALRAVVADAGQLDAVGHRVVHGGPNHQGSVVISDDVMAELEQLRDLAPLHNGPALDAMAAARRMLPAVPHVAAFDTAFHATLPEEAITYPLPFEWRSGFGVRRYGFHGLSVTWASERAAELLGRPLEELRLVVAHLGSGCSVTAVDGGRSMDTSMGMTPLEGLMMATRSGSVDPGILLELLARGEVSADELANTLQHASGLLGVSGLSGDLREVQAAAAGGDERAQLALAMFARRAAAGIAAVASALPVLDALVFTGGIGEHAALVRAAICARLATLGVPAVPGEPDDGDDRVLSERGSSVAVLRVSAREDLVIARETARLVTG